MVERTLTIDTLKKIGETVVLKGWIDTKRDHGKVTFLDLRDRTGKIQVVATGGIGKEYRTEDVVEITGAVQQRPENLVNPKITTGTVELAAESIKLISKAAELPFDTGTEDLHVELPTLLDYRSLTLRHPKVKAIFKVQAVVIDAFRRALQAKDFHEFQAPSIISSAPEGGADIFEVKYFDYKAYLAQSPQLYKSLLVSVFERVFSVNKVWRAEPSVTTRHLTEVVSLDAEMGFIESWTEVRDMAEYVIKFVLNEVAQTCGPELAMYGATVPMVPDKIPTVKLREAQQIIFERTGRDVRQEKDLAPEDEREICLWAKEVHGSELVFVSHYPTKFRPFYTYPDDENPEFNQGFDLLGRGVEWLSGGRRIHDYTMIMEHVKEWGITPEHIEMYLQAYRYGMPPLGGFAFGAERITMQVLGLKNIREAVLFPRDMERVDVRLNTIQKPQSKLDQEALLKSLHNKDIHSALIAYLDKAGVAYETITHAETLTSEESAAARGTNLHQGAKAMLLSADGEHVMLVLPADERVDFKLVKEALQAKKVELVDRGLVESIAQVPPGAVPPFGSLLKLPTYVMHTLSDNEVIAFNAGKLDTSIKMKYVDYLAVEQPTVL